MNYLCKCGCGREVSTPWGQYILGHSTPRKLSGDDARQIRRLRRKGVTCKELARQYGVSQALITQASMGYMWRRESERGGRYVSPSASREITRSEDIEARNLQIEERLCLKQGKKTLQQLTRLLKHRAV